MAINHFSRKGWVKLKRRFLRKGGFLTLTQYIFKEKGIVLKKTVLKCFKIFKNFQQPFDEFWNSYLSKNGIPSSLFFQTLSIGFRIATYIKTGLSQRYFPRISWADF